MIPGSRLGIPSAPGTRKHRRLEGLPVNVTVGVAGTASFTWPGVPADEMWTGAVSVPQAAPSSVRSILWSATDGGSPIGQWYDSQSSGPLQVNTQLQVTGSGITPGALVATFQGIATDIASAPPWWPAPTPAPPPSAPRVIVSNNVALPAGNTVQIGSDQPVIVGTALEVFEAATAHQGAGSNVRLYIRWSVDGSFVNPIEWTMDLADAVSMRGLILPHLAPFVRFLAISGGQEQISLTVVTGLPPVVRPPIVANGMLISQNIAAAAVGDTTIAIPPYVGPAVLSLLLNSTAPNSQLYAHITHADYLGTDLGSTWVNPQASADTGRLASLDPIILPIPVNLPPVVNKLIITNGMAAPARIYVTLIPTGP